ncbi:MAG: tRNA uridine-5-carboxymethylaminomethyl(34) synthesis GTPase MnmE [Clostridia bacterium]|nr:tRNA uridine-5-carboxymethylaminomethyl(34) synthesis GTPase MnmE [Clostridia bacterium]
MPESTIAAISTPKGEGSISVIRISGGGAIAVAEKCFVAASGKRLSDMSGYSAAFGEVVRRDKTHIDEAVALVFRAPKSYTGEDVVELSVHGGIVPARECLKCVFAAGARSAAPGEFTKRAFLNGKIDLTEAESIMEIIGAKGEAALSIAKSAKEGKISRDIEKITDKLLFAAASLAAYSDFPEEDIEGLDGESFIKMLNECEESLIKLISGFEAGQAVLAGVRTAIVGKPNVGKSTLMNMLSRQELSIVTPLAGTTRDIIEKQVNIGDIILLLSDTAGIRDSGDVIEHIGVERAIKKIQNSQLVLAVFDISQPFDDEDKKIMNLLKSKKCIAVLNKSDLPQKADLSGLAGFDTVLISAKNKTGYSELSKEISKVCGTTGLSPDDAILLNERQYSCATRAKTALSEAKEALTSGITLDAVTVLIDDAVNALLELSGKRASESIVNEIFKNFCIGK